MHTSSRRVQEIIRIKNAMPKWCLKCNLIIKCFIAHAHSLLDVLGKQIELMDSSV